MPTNIQTPPIDTQIALYNRQYADEFLKWMKAFPFTHKDISERTNCNCSYSVLRTLKQKYKFSERWEYRFDSFLGRTKPHKVYTYEGEQQ